MVSLLVNWYYSCTLKHFPDHSFLYPPLPPPPPSPLPNLEMCSWAVPQYNKSKKFHLKILSVFFSFFNYSKLNNDNCLINFKFYNFFTYWVSLLNIFLIAYRSFNLHNLTAFPGLLISCISFLNKFTLCFLVSREKLLWSDSLSLIKSARVVLHNLLTE